MIVHLLEQGSGRRSKRRAAFHAEVRRLRGDHDDEHKDDDREANKNFVYQFHARIGLFLGVQVDDRREATKFVSMLNKLGYPAIDLTDDELAKVHVRHLVGGRVSGMMHELIYRFEFPERPGALLKFLSHMSAGWNITLFH